MIKSIRKTIGVVALAGLLLAGAGCGNLLGVVATKTSGPTVKAKYEPKAHEPMLLLVESYRKEMDSGLETAHLITTLSKSITEYKIAPLVDNQKLEHLRDSDPEAYNKPMPIAEIGRRCGARQILYVNVNDIEILAPAGSGQVRGKMKAVVRIIDSETGEVRWPVDAPSEAVEIQTPWKVVDSSFTQTDLRALMSDQMAEDISKLFRDTHPDQEPMGKSIADE